MFKKKHDHNVSFTWTEGLLPHLDESPLEHERKKTPYRLIVFFLLIAIVTSIILARLFQLQIISAAQYSVLADINRIDEHYIPYERGLIIDTDGTVLARNIPTYEAVATLDTIPTGDVYLEWITTASNIFNLEPIALETSIEKIRAAGDTEVVIAADVDQSIFISFMTHTKEIPGVTVRPVMKRFYPTGLSTAHVVGYLGELNADERKRREFADYVNGEELGRSGIEATYQAILRGEPGLSVLSNTSGTQQDTSRIVKASVPGKSIKIGISSSLQNKVLDVLRTSLEEHESPSGVVIVQDIHSGTLKVVASLPSFDNNVFTDGLNETEFKELFENKAQPLFHRAIAGEYPPGSLVKPVVGAAALEEKIITPTTFLTDTPQVIEIGGGRFADWRVSWGRGPYGQMTVKEAIAQSSNIFYYKISGGYETQQGLGIKKISDYFHSFGIGKLTGIDIPGEADGLVPTPAWKLAVRNENWYLGDDYQVGIGQGDVLVTPLQMVNAVSAIANGGTLYKPRVATAIYDYDDELIEELPAEVIAELPISKDFLATIQEGMRLAVSEGIVFPLRNTRVQVAAKTGTAEFGVRDDEGVYKTHAWVEGYFPYDAPKYSFVVLLENGGSSQYAAELAAKVVEMF